MKWLLAFSALLITSCAPVVTENLNSYTITEDREGKLLIGASDPITSFSPIDKCNYLAGIFEANLKLECISPVVVTLETTGEIFVFYTNDKGLPLALPGN